MKYVITGGAGNISKPLTLSLLKAGHEVIVVGRNESNLKELLDAGAKAAIGSIKMLHFLQKHLQALMQCIRWCRQNMM